MFIIIFNCYSTVYCLMWKIVSLRLGTYMLTVLHTQPKFITIYLIFVPGFTEVYLSDEQFK